MIDYTQIKNSYAYGNPDAHLLLEQALCEAAGHCTNDRELGRIARHLAASMDAAPWIRFRPNQNWTPRRNDEKI